MSRVVDQAAALSDRNILRYYGEKVMYGLYIMDILCSTNDALIN
jgi:hypothetical protein